MSDEVRVLVGTLCCPASFGRSECCIATPAREGVGTDSERHPLSTARELGLISLAVEASLGDLVYYVQ